MTVGRPTDYTEELGDAICAEIALGRSLVKICEDEGMPVTQSVYRWRRLHPEFSDNYAHAREDAADVFAEEIITIPDNEVGNPVMVDGVPLMVGGKIVMAVDSASVAHAKLRTDNRKWIASRFNRAYQETKSTEHSGPNGAPIGITAAVVGAEMSNDEASNIYKDLMG
jgi:hypothetical protein